MVIWFLTAFSLVMAVVHWKYNRVMGAVYWATIALVIMALGLLERV